MTVAGSEASTIGGWRRGEGQQTFVGALLGLANVRSRLEEVENLLGEGGIGQRPGYSTTVSPLVLSSVFFDPFSTRGLPKEFGMKKLTSRSVVSHCFESLVFFSF